MSVTEKISFYTDQVSISAYIEAITGLLVGIVAIVFISYSVFHLVKSGLKWAVLGANERNAKAILRRYT